MYALILATLVAKAIAVTNAAHEIDAAIVAKGGTTQGGLTNAAAAIAALPSGDDRLIDEAKNISLGDITVSGQPYVPMYWLYRAKVGRVSFPDAIGGYVSSVNWIMHINGANGFLSESTVTSFIAPKISSLPGRSFDGCTMLESVSCDSLMFAQNKCFTSSSRITELNFPSLISIGADNFKDLTAVTNVYLPNLQTIGTYSFRNLSSLKRVSLPSCTTISFQYCQNLEEIDAENVTTIQGEGLSRNTKITRYYFPRITEIGTWAMNDCSSLTNVSLPSLTGSIGGQSLNGCVKLEELNVPLFNGNYLALQGTCGRDAVNPHVNISKTMDEVLAMTGFPFGDNTASIRFRFVCTDGDIVYDSSSSTWVKIGR